MRESAPLEPREGLFNRCDISVGGYLILLGGFGALGNDLTSTLVVLCDDPS